MSTLPVRRVVLYKHGVGYFEREAEVHGEETLALSFKQREVSDVLKSLTVLDLGGGTISAVSYDSTTPIEKLLAEIALSIPDSGSLVGLLPQLKGARASVKPTGGSLVQGTILGIDSIETSTVAGITTQVRLSLLTDSGEMRTFDLYDLELTLLDEGIKRDLDFYLKTQLASKKKDDRTFTLFAQGEGLRRVRLSYVLEAPVWKATYRILLGEDHASGIAGAVDNQPLIQGWAVVDNTSDEDWVDVELTLVAGLPVSFVHDLYTPRYISRPVIAVRETTGVLPPIAESGVENFGDAESLTADYAMASMSAPGAPMARRDASRKRAMDRSEAAAQPQSGLSSVHAQTRERQVGDLFEYGIEKPVTVRRNQSALVPIVLKPFAGKSVLLYQKAARAENPMRCVEFENTTGLTLEGGPVTVLEQGSYVGEAMLDTLKPTEKRLVGYAVELAVRVLDNVESFRQRINRVVIRQGTLIAYFGQAVQTTYTFSSKSDQNETLYLDHPRPGSDWNLIDTPAAHEVTENYWRFKLSLPANKAVKFVVKSEQTQSQVYALGDVSEAQLGIWVQSRFIDQKTEKVLRESFEIRQELAGYETKLQELANERHQIHQEQGRIRENLGSLGDRASEKELRERFVRTLGMQEDRLEAIGQDEKQNQAKRDAARARLHTMLANLKFEATVPE